MARILLPLVFVVLLGVEWRYRLRIVRLTAVLLAVVIWSFAQPLAHRAARWAIIAPPRDRVTRFVDGPPLTDYESGVATMEHAVFDDMKIDADTRTLCEVVVLWLAFSPVLRRAHGSFAEGSVFHARADTAR